MKQDVALQVGEIMADRWRDFVVESYQLGGLGEEKWTASCWH